MQKSTPCVIPPKQSCATRYDYLRLHVRREKPERIEYLDEAANTRAEDYAFMNSIRFNNQPHTRPDGSRWFTILGVDKNYNYGENARSGCFTAEAHMKIWAGST